MFCAYVLNRSVVCASLRSHGLSRQEDWSGLPRPPPGDLPSSGIEPRSPALQEDSLLSEPPGKPFQEYILFKISKTKQEIYVTV